MMTNTLPAYWKWDAALNDEQIDKFIGDAEAQSKQKGTVFSDAVNDVRDSDVVLFSGEHWLAGVLFNYAFSANQHSGWNRELLGMETVQYAEYGIGQKYDWHHDTKFITTDPVHRKLTVVCLLNDPSEYVGGSFEFEGHSEQPALGKGSVLVFPSLLRHRVTPVTKGLRKSATLWVVGPTAW